jgi:hypothetical protein
MMRAVESNDIPKTQAEGDADFAANGSNIAKRWASWVLPATWVVNAALLVAAVGWIYFDGRSLPTAEWLVSKAPFRSSATGGQITGSTKSGTDSLIAATCLVMAAVSLLVMLGGLFVGNPRFRSLRMWLAFIALAAGWLGLLSTWPEIYWRGQQRRVVHELASAETMARFLEKNWPKEDGDLAGVGPYIAYPKGAPTVMLPLRWITFPDTPLRFSAVERSADGTIRFELAGDETGAWLEWRRDEGAPASFTGGLETVYRVGRSQQLAPHWYLVRYHVDTMGS